MAIELHRLIESYCTTLLKVHSTFLVMQRSAFFELFQDEINRLALNENYFLGLDEVSFSLHLRPRKPPLLLRWWNKLLRRTSQPVFDLVSPTCPDAILCTVIFRRQGNEFKASIKMNEENVKQPIYVDLA
ncbi:MAG: hypothetical protein N2662_08770 [Bacteroidales bacterium]|nr:hypothetical protein [Bacteroidales bacterium]